MGIHLLNFDELELSIAQYRIDSSPLKAEANRTLARSMAMKRFVVIAGDPLWTRGAPQ
jgi:hypothetical protein